MRLPGLANAAPALPNLLNTTRDVFLAYLGQVTVWVDQMPTVDPYDSYGSHELAAGQRELTVCQEMHIWTQCVMDCLASFRSGQDAPLPVEPPRWLTGPGQVRPLT